MKKLLALALALVVLTVLTGFSVAQQAGITATIPLTDPTTGERITPSVLGVNPTTNQVYVGGFTFPSNQAVLAMIE